MCTPAPPTVDERNDRHLRIAIRAFAALTERTTSISSCFAHVGDIERILLLLFTKNKIPRPTNLMGGNPLWLIEIVVTARSNEVPGRGVVDQYASSFARNNLP